MRLSRAPEHRGGGGSPVFLLLIVLILLVVGVAVIYLVLNGSSAAPVESNPPANVQSAPQEQPAISNDTAVAQAPALRSTAVSSNPSLENRNQETLKPRAQFTPPDVDFGEVISDGFVDLVIQNVDVRVWYTYQVDTGTERITMVFALFNQASGEISRKVVIRKYNRSTEISNGEVTIYYPDAPERITTFDRETGTIKTSQVYPDQPYGPNLFSPEARIALVADADLSSLDGTFNASLHNDPTGISANEGLEVTRSAPQEVNAMLAALQEVVDDIESRRPQS